MLDAFLTFVNEESALNKGVSLAKSCLLLTVSGGIDSVVLVDLCNRANIRFGIAHVNFGLRAEESDADEAFVRQLSQYYGVRFHRTQFETKKIAHERGVSVQMAARELRYSWFNEVADAFGYDFIATAHHQNDVLETVLLNLVRGTGIAGLRGIPIRQGRVVRPLWFATRPEIFAYLQERGLQWREDSSNSNDKYLRNHLRHQVVPDLEVLNPNFWGTFRHTVERLRAAEIVLDQELAQSWQLVADMSVPDRIVINPSALLALTEPVFRLEEWLRPYGFNGEQARSIVNCLSHPPGQVFESSTHRIWHDRSGLLLTPLPEQREINFQLANFPIEAANVAGLFRLKFQLFDKPTDFQPSPDRQVACFDADTFQLPITVRNWQLGDRFQPFGMKGSKLVSNLLNDQKISLPDRSQVCVLLSGEDIAWVIGYRVAHQFRIQAKTKRVLMISKQ